MRFLLCTIPTLTACLALASGCFGNYDEGLLEAGTDAEVGPCTPRVPPPRPEGADGDDGEEYIFGLRHAILDQRVREAWKDIGLDLDGYCTEAPSEVSECTPPEASFPPVDGLDGIDNVFGASLFPLVEAAAPGLEMTAQQAQDEGKLPVMRLRGWNGLDNDSHVDVTITNAIFVVPAGTDDLPLPFTVENFEPVDMGGARLPFPNWDGNDYGYFREDNFLDNDPEQPTIRDDQAYVTDRVVVARLPDRVEILFPADEVGVNVRLTDATALGRISEDGLSLEDVIVAGRWSLTDLLSTAENVGLCQGSGEYNVLRGTLRGVADVRSDPATGGPGAECNAISIGVAWTGTRMRWGGLTPGPGIPNSCEGMGTDGGVDTDGGVGADAGAGMDAGVPMDGG